MDRFKTFIKNELLIKVIGKIQKDFNQEIYKLDDLYNKALLFNKSNMDENEMLAILIKAAVELTSKDAPDWEFIAARLLNYNINKNIETKMKELNINNFKDKIYYLTRQKLYGEYILENYSEDELDQLSDYIKEDRNNLFTYSGLDLVYKRYLIRNGDNVIMEKPQEMFMGIAMHLAIPEGKNKLYWSKRIYDILSQLKVTMATPTMSNARKPYHQLSSCFIDTVPDSLDGIYRSIDSFAKISKFGGGMGLYFGKVRAVGSDIRGFKGVAGGVNRWIKLANDTAVAVDQLGVRHGSVAVYLDIWHKDVLEFLQLKTNNGDDRLKAHDVFPAICYPNLFWKLAKESIDSTWYMMCPHEVLKYKGYSLEDYYGDEWEKRYNECIQDQRISKREISIKELVRLILKSVTETGTPFAFNRDIVNEMNPNAHKGIIYSSNLCTEIAQNMSQVECISTEIINQDGNTIVVNKTSPGDFVVCNLASLVVGNIDVEDEDKLKDTIETAVRALDNVIDLNFYPIPYAKITNHNYRSIGLGVGGYHHLLASKGIKWESDEHIQYVDKLFEKINYYAIKTSCNLAKEKGAYKYFNGSDWETGVYFEKRNYKDTKWDDLRNEIFINGIRNAYIMAIAPTSSTSIIAGTTASIDPIMNKYFLEEKKGSIVPRVAPNLNPSTFWLYKSAHTIDQHWIIKAAAVRQRHIDQSQSLNFYITPEYTMRQILDLYINAWESGIKTIYYVRSKSLETKECDSCSA